MNNNNYTNNVSGNVGYMNNAYGNNYTGNYQTVNYQNESNVYITKKQRSNQIVSMIIGVVCGALLILCPLMNYATLHFDITASNVFNMIINQYMGEETDDLKNETLSSNQESNDIDFKATYGLDMFELRQMGSNYVEFGKVSSEEMQDWKDSIKEVEDYVRYEIDLKSVGINIDDEVYNELFGLLGTSIYAYNPLCIVPYILMAAGLFIIIFSAFKKSLIAFIFHIIAMGSTGWLIFCTDRFLSVMGIGAIILIIVLITGFINSICGMAIKKK